MNVCMKPCQMVQGLLMLKIALFEAFIDVLTNWNLPEFVLNLCMFMELV